ncbi:MHS family MFS transporter [Geodermatophilus sp. YIM 151500]|uniref:MFS transporter n=1 Tax=Geodermatophilus sp. YIM 151500 TaxID=2984531 RepID=UPI0021E3F20C|nr:MFS transporter [Geodermatophilus sp. YIM 151500]MCV2487866.1 MHS family MFS transporter [Geodermatophilus sp. YIM 151500]
MRDAVVEPSGSHEPEEFRKSPRKAAASGWMGSALEYYDFFIYAQAAALVFPTIFFAESDPQVAIIASLATFGVGYVARPIGAFVLGHWGDTHGRKNVLVLCMLLMGVSTFLVALLPTYQQVGLLAPALLVVLRLVQGFAVGGEISGASAMIVEHAPFGRRGYYASFTLQGVQAGQILAAAVFLPLSVALPEAAFQSWGWRIPFLLSALVVVAGYVIRRRVDETPVFQEEAAHGEVPKAPIVQAVRESGRDMLRVVLMALMNAVPVATTVFGAAYATNEEEYGIGFSTATYLWISVVGNAVAVLLIPFVGNLSDRIGRRPCIIVGALGSTALSFAYLWAISQGSVGLAFVLAILMWGVVYQGYNAVFPAFYQELFPTRTRVTAFAVSQNLGTMITAFLPTLYAIVAPGGSNVPLIVGGITFGIGIIAALSAWSARETYRVHMNDLGRDDAVEVPREEYERIRSGA